MGCRVYVIGFGLGNPDLLTVRAREALCHSDLVIGSQRLLEALDALPDVRGRRMALVRSEQIADVLRASDVETASVVMSGDVGLYSGATGLLPLLDGMDVKVIPGVSSLQYLCARLQMPWQDVHMVSAHGRACDVAGAVQCHARTFVLMGGATSAADACAELMERGLGETRVWVGERLSYADERITCGIAAELSCGEFDALAAMLVENDHPLDAEPATPHLSDKAFVRGKVPMTKEEVRELALCKLRVRPTSVVWDVGAGTGSVSVEAARSAYAGQVIAVERNEEAVALLERNRVAFGLSNLRIVQGMAPEALAGLPAPDCVFVGGSSGRLEQILLAALEANPCVRLCVTAITLETLLELLDCVRRLPLADVDIAQVSVAKAQVAGTYHLMRAQNPVYVVSACGQGVACNSGDRDGADEVDARSAISRGEA